MRRLCEADSLLLEFRYERSSLTPPAIPAAWCLTSVEAVSAPDLARAGLDLSFATRRAAAADPERIVARHRDASFALADLDARADALAGGLQQMGLVPGDVVALLGAGRLEFLVALVGIARAGAIAAVIPAATTPAELPVVTGRHAPRYVLGTPETAALADAIATRHAAPAFQLPHWPSAGHPQHVEIDPACDAMILFTSGTTGDPKAIVRSHRSVMSHGVLQVDELGLDPDCVLGTVQLSHEAPAQIAAGGGCFVVVDGIAPTTWLAAIEERQITHLGASPPLLLQWFDAPNVDDYDLTSLRSVISAAMPLPPDLRPIVERHGPQLTDLYGTVEAGVIALNGRVVRGKEARVDDDGELHVRPTGELEAGFHQGWAEKGRWLATGDLATLHDGVLRIEGRTIDTINIAGDKVHAPQVERVIRSHPAVIDAAVVGLDDARHGEVVACAVVVRDGADVDIRELKDHCRSQLAEFKVPRVVAIRAALPRTATGKVDKGTLRRQLHSRI
jgi:acyl-CoA synthetase (AMP-forming)/AMP-acid ligase II